MRKVSSFGALTAPRGASVAPTRVGQQGWAKWSLRNLTVRRFAFLTICIAFVGCSDHVTDVGDGPAHLITPSPRSSDIATDGDINFNDTWVSETDVVAESTTVSSGNAFLNPNTQQLVTSMALGTEPETVSVLAGYGFDGQARVTTGFSTTNELATSLVRQIGGTTYDASQGQSLNYGTFDVEPIASLGSLQNAQLDPTDPCANAIDVELCREQQGQSVVAVPARGATTVAGGSSAVASPSARTRIDGTHVRVVETLAFDAVPQVKSLSRSNVQPTSMNSNGESGRRTKDYEKRGNDWVLTHIMDEVFDIGPNRSTRHVVHHQITGLRFSRNRSLDSIRARNRATAKPSTAISRSRLIRPGPRSSDVDPTCDAASANLIVACDQPGGGGGGGPTDPPAPNQTVVNATENVVAANGGATGIVLQHGFFSSAQTWGRMANWLHSEVRSSGIVAKSTAWAQTYESQAGELSDIVGGSFGSSPVVLVGHSNGGLISRYLAEQQFPSQANVAGVIAIGSPHWGTPLANAGSAVNRLLGVGGFASFLLCHVTDNQGGCLNLMNAVSSGVGNIFVQATAPIPILSEMHWHDAYHTTFNATGEGFQRFGIASQMWTKWIFWRQYGDTFCYEDSQCGGSAQVAKIDKIYHHDITCSIISGLFFNISGSAKCAGDAAFLRAFDSLFQGYVKGPGEAYSALGDGVVPQSSQTYPNIPAPNLFVVTDGPNHLGETSDARVKNFVTQILATRLNFVPGP
jgi:hypothetical protein